MADVPKVHRVNSDQLKTGTAVEQAEHPWASKATAKRIATDHIRKNPSEYKEGKHSSSHGGEQVVVIVNERVHVSSTPKKKKDPKPVQQGFDWQNWGRELL